LGQEELYHLTRVVEMLVVHLLLVLWFLLLVEMEVVVLLIQLVEILVVEKLVELEQIMVQEEVQEILQMEITEVETPEGLEEMEHQTLCLVLP
jgi:hypothetical protein